MEKLDESLKNNGKRFLRAIRNNGSSSTKLLRQFLNRLMKSERVAFLINIISIAGYVPESLLEGFTVEIQELESMVHGFLDIADKVIAFSASSVYSVWLATVAERAEEDIVCSSKAYKYLSSELSLSDSEIQNWRSYIEANPKKSEGQHEGDSEKVEIEKNLMEYLKVSREHLTEAVSGKYITPFRNAITFLWENRANFSQPLALIGLTYWRILISSSAQSETFEEASRILEEDFIGKSWSSGLEEYKDLRRREELLTSRIPLKIERLDGNDLEKERFLGDMYLIYGRIVSRSDPGFAQRLYLESIAHLKKATDHRHSNLENSTELLAVSTTELGILYSEDKKLDEAIDMFQKAIEVSRLVQRSYLHGRLRSQNILATSYRLLGEALVKKNCQDKAIGNFEDALELYKILLTNADDSLGAIENDLGLTLFHLGEVLLDVNRFLEAEEKLVEAFELFEHLNAIHVDNVVYLQNESRVADALSQLHMAMNDNRGGYEELRMFECAIKSHDLRHSTDQFLQVGSLLIDVHEARKTQNRLHMNVSEIQMRYFQEKKRKESYQYPDISVRKLLYLFNDFVDLKDTYRAEKAIEQSVALFEETFAENRSTQSSLSNAIGKGSSLLADLFRQEGQREESKTSFEKAIKYYELGLRYLDENSLTQAIQERLIGTNRELSIIENMQHRTTDKDKCAEVLDLRKDPLVSTEDEEFVADINEKGKVLSSMILENHKSKGIIEEYLGIVQELIETSNESFASEDFKGAVWASLQAISSLNELSEKGKEGLSLDGEILLLDAKVLAGKAFMELKVYQTAQNFLDNAYEEACRLMKDYSNKTDLSEKAMKIFEIGKEAVKYGGFNTLRTFMNTNTDLRQD